MKQLKLISGLLVFMLVLSACGGGSKIQFEKDTFIASYNKAATITGAAAFTEDAITSPMILNGKPSDDTNSFTVNESVFASGTLIFEGDRIWLVGKPSDIPRFLVEIETVVMAVLDADQVIGDEVMDELFFAEGAIEREHASGFNRSLEKTIKRDGFTFKVSVSDRGMIDIVITPA